MQVANAYKDQVAAIKMLNFFAGVLFATSISVMLLAAKLKPAIFVMEKEQPEEEGKENGVSRQHKRISTADAITVAATDGKASK